MPSNASAKNPMAILKLLSNHGDFLCKAKIMLKEVQRKLRTRDSHDVRLAT